MVHVEIGSSLKVGRFTDAEFRCLVTGVWALAAKTEPRGCLAIGGTPATETDVARQAHCSVTLAKRTIEKMHQLGMLEYDAEHDWYAVHDWDLLNPAPKNDRTNADRQRRYRALRNGVTNGDSNGPPTPRNAPEVEGEGEVNPSTNVEGVVAAPPASPTDLAVEELCLLMSHHVRTAHGIDPSSKEARVNKGWRDACRAMLTLDGYTREQIAFAIEWVCRHHHWSRRVKSMTRLRSEMGQVVKEIREQRERGGQVVPMRRENASDLLRALDGGAA